MKLRGQIFAGDESDGFDRSVAEKMPKIKKEEEGPLPPPEEEKRPSFAPPQKTKSSEPAVEMKAPFLPPEREEDENAVVLKLIEDLHGQLLVSNRAKRTLEIDLSASQKTIQKLAQEKKALEGQVEVLKKEGTKVQEIQSELSYLEEENEDALERMAALQAERKTLQETLAQTMQERDQAFVQIKALEARIEQNDLLRIKEKLREREVSHYTSENREIQARLEESLARNSDLEERYEALKKSFHEVKESLTLLRDTCKTQYYNLDPPAEPGQEEGRERSPLTNTLRRAALEDSFD